jgi:processive 1,2-diacylglycerol beta-glucosyltransferase
MTRKKILLAYITRYSGHHKASLAIKEALIKLGVNRDNVKDIDFLRYLHPVGRFIVEKSYLRMLKKNPQTWEYLYDNPEVYGRLKKWVNRLGAWKSWKLTRLIEKFDPDIICCTQAFPALMLANFKQHGSLKMALTPIVGVLTDYSPHRYWVHQEINLYVVPSKEVGQVLIEKGISENRVRDFGIPIDPKFLNHLDKGKVLKKLGFNEVLPVVLIMGGGRGLGLIKEVVEELEKHSLPLQLAVVCGRNKKLQKELEKITPLLHYPAKILGYAENMNELMKISSVIITKPGGLTVSECLACELPMILVNPIPGQEALNAQFLVEHNLAITVPDEKEAASAAVRLLKDESARQQMRAQARAFSRPDAALVIAYNLIKGWA